MPVLEAYIPLQVAHQKVQWDLWKQVDIYLLKYEQHIVIDCNILKFFSQNIRKNKLIVDTILETQSVKIVDSGLYFIFSFHFFYFTLLFFFLFYF